MTAGIAELVNKCFEMSAEIAEEKDDFRTSHEQAGKRSKLGVHEFSTNCIKIAEFLGFSPSKAGDERSSSKEYGDLLEDGQNDIYDCTGEKNEFCAQPTKKLDGKKLGSTTLDGLDLEDVDEKKKLEERIEPAAALCGGMIRLSRPF